MATPSPTSSPPSDSNPNSAATPPHQQPTDPSSPPPSHMTVVALAATTSSVARKTQPVLWTHDETLLLIESFKEKWYAIGRGPLKSTHWEEIAVAVSARSGVDRSSTQCRHKIEKLRKRFRSERQSMGPISIWPFYNQMEEMDSNPAPISARPLTRLPPNSNSHYQDDEEEDQEEEEDNYEKEEEDERQSKSRSINYILRRPGTVNRFAGVGGGLLSWGQRERSTKRKRNNDGGDGGERRRKGARAVAAEIRAFAERVMVMEKKKMEFAKETVRLRKEMEIKRINLIKTSQAQLLQFLNSSFDSSSF
ncbi:PREDICTED: trihelix transcription factor ASIL1-like [Camelina sativa]|uniref:Trihelix transcription factor ASIL1-like n=1 Tax=Camelina sativa TaxID=90675 RepID=A0ABM0W7T0_CAMSA|nr:PREDICTED: trihelix transcription factor ASIL1-like [Camelina sativa]